MIATSFSSAIISQHTLFKSTRGDVVNSLSSIYTRFTNAGWYEKILEESKGRTNTGSTGILVQQSGNRILPGESLRALDVLLTENLY